MSLKKIKHIGHLKGPIVCFGGVYSNLQALQELKKWCDKNDFLPNRIICTGDIVGYCAQPDECIQFIKAWGIHSIVGNVEVQIREDKDDCGCDFESGGRCDMFSRQWYPFARKNVSHDSKTWLLDLPDFIEFELGEKKGLVVHGSYFNTSEFIFESSPWSKKQRNFEESKTNLIVAGHSGIPFQQTMNQYTWLNAGVIGMPANDGETHVWFTVISNPELLKIEFKSLIYPHQKASELMVENNLPNSYAKTLLTGVWDNTEILPEKETSMAGRPLQLN